MPRVIAMAVLGCCLAALVGCGPRADVTTSADPAPSLELVLPGRWPVLADDLDSPSLLRAIDHALGYYERVPGDRPFRFGSELKSAAALRQGLLRVRQIVSDAHHDEWTKLLQRDFLLFRSVGRDGRGEVLFTGYFEPILSARRQATGDFRFPIYEVPRDLLNIDLADFGAEREGRLVGRVEGRRVVPYHDREAIDFGGVLEDGGASVIAYLDDPVQLFFLHVQGSGTLEFEDGQRLRAGYAAANGRPYRSIGRLLMDEGLMTVDEMSMQGIIDFLAAHPGQLRRVLGANPSYVFFRALDPAGGPLGCFEIPLVAERSIATDRTIFPAPALCWVHAPIPDGDDGTQDMERLVVNLDTGGAIRGPGRVDLFFGAGPAAGERAGRTKHRGELFILLPRQP